MYRSEFTGQSTISVKTPGKLMVAGEYAVLEQYQRLIVTAIDRFVQADLTPSETGTLTIPALDIEQALWHVEEGKVVLEAEGKQTSFVQEAMQTVFTYLTEQDIAIQPFDLTITSDLDDVSGKKYGLGSSGAVTTAVVKAILEFLHTDEITEDLIFKLSSIAHVKVQGNGSGADVAASSYGGWLEYASFQAEWLLEEIGKGKSISRLVKRNWQYFKLEKLTFPEDLHMCIGWTGQPASTSQFVQKIQEFKHQDHTAYAEFMVQSNTAVRGVLTGMSENDLNLFFEGIQMNRVALQQLGEKAGVPIETAELKTLCDIAEQLGGVAKPSGAGGGDCGIAFVSSREKADELAAAWEKAGIQTLDIQPIS